MMPKNVRYIVSALSLLTIFSFANCKKEKKNDDQNMAIALMAMNRPAASGANALNSNGATSYVLPTRLSIVSNTSSITTSNSVLNQAIRSLQNTDISSIAKSILLATQAETDGVSTKGDFAKDEPEVFSMDPITYQLKQIDQFFQMMNLSGYKYLVDKGPRKVKFTMPMDQSSSGGSSGGAQGQAQKANWTVQASTTDGPPLLVKMWGSLNFGVVKPKLTLAFKVLSPPTNKEVTIDGVKSTVQTGGAFEMALSLSLDDAASGSKMSGIFILKKSTDSATNKEELKIWDTASVTMNMNGNTITTASTESIVIETSNGGESGKVTQRLSYNAGQGDMNFPVSTSSWNKDYVYTQLPDMNTGKSVESIISRNNPEKIVYSYGLYNAEGNRVVLNTGFPVKSGTKEGWASRWGVSFYDQATGLMSNAVDNEKVTEVKFDGTVGGEYTVSVIPGRVSRQIRETIALADLKDVPLTYYDPTTYAEFVVKYDGTNWVKSKSCTNDPNTYKKTCTDTSGNLTINAGQFYFFYLAGESSSGKSLNFIGGQTNVIAEIFEEVDENATAKTLYKYDANACYTAGGVGYTGTQYTLGTDLTLKSGSTIVTQPVYGMHGTALSFANVNECQKIFDPATATVTYSWNYGTNEWEKKAILKNADGTPVKFDKPIPFTIKTAKGMFTANYMGFGQFDIPWVQDPNADPNDFMSYKPVAVIPDGSKLSTKTLDSTTGTASEVSYYVKHLSVAIKYNPAAAGTDVSALKTEAATALADFTPSDEDKKFADIGADPTKDSSSTAVCIVDGNPVNSEGKQVASFADSVCAK
ncbi:MAG: hypothetical protein H7A25_07570 [Leptospiraceae bacterium]|nr:hypothetical protein [Leptospiraceae bacterium]MCP5499743.1 hypothetical protein [Leptospiraceae bacterium]